jgi:hypothetical protein
MERSMRNIFRKLRRLPRRQVWSFALHLPKMIFQKALKIRKLFMVME